MFDIRFLFGNFVQSIVVLQNLPDMAHLNTLHAGHSFKFLEIISRWVNLPNRWEATWQIHATKPFITESIIRNFVGNTPPTEQVSASV